MQVTLEIKALKKQRDQAQKDYEEQLQVQACVAALNGWVRRKAHSAKHTQEECKREQM